MAFIRDNFANAIAESLVNGTEFYQMKFGSGTGTINTLDNSSGLFMETYSELFSDSGNSVDITNSDKQTQVDFNVVISPLEGNGSGGLSYSELGIFTKAGKKLTHYTYPEKFKGSNTTINFKYTLKFGRNV